MVTLIRSHSLFQSQKSSSSSSSSSSNRVPIAMDPSVANDPELMRFLNEEKHRAAVKEAVAKLTSVCWDKCITSSPGSKFSSSETSCLTFCAQRYGDLSMLLMKRFQQ